MNLVMSVAGAWEWRQSGRQTIVIDDGSEQPCLFASLQLCSVEGIARVDPAAIESGCEPLGALL